VLCTNTKASFADLPRRLLQRQQPAARWRLATIGSRESLNNSRRPNYGVSCGNVRWWADYSLCRCDDKYYKDMKCITALSFHHFIGLQCFSGQFPISATFHRTVAIAGHFGTSAEMSRPNDHSVRAYGPNCLTALGPKCLSAKMSWCRSVLGHLGTGAEVS